MRTIYQPDKEHCGIACVAMLAGTNFEKAKRAMMESYETEDTTPAQLRAALHQFGVGTDRMRRIGNLTYSKMKFDAALLGIDRSDGIEHWVVWDHNSETLRDPYRNGTWFECRSYVRIRTGRAGRKRS